MNIIHFMQGATEYRLAVSDETLEQLVYDRNLPPVEVVVSNGPVAVEGEPTP